MVCSPLGSIREARCLPGTERRSAFGPKERCICEKLREPPLQPPQVEPGLKIRIKQNQIHQKRANDFRPFSLSALRLFVHFRFVFRPKSAQVLPKDFEAA